MLTYVTLLLAVGLGNAALATERFPLMQPEGMTADQKTLSEVMLQGPRKSLGGPYNGWLRSPEFARRMIAVGNYTRTGTQFPERLRFLIALITARSWDSQYEWSSNTAQALAAGLTPDTLAAIKDGQRPRGLGADDHLVYDFCIELRRDKQVSNPTFEKVLAHFGERGIIDIIAINIYFDAIGMTLNVTERPLPEGMKPELMMLGNARFPVR